MTSVSSQVQGEIERRTISESQVSNQSKIEKKDQSSVESFCQIKAPSGL